MRKFKIILLFIAFTTSSHADDFSSYELKGELKPKPALSCTTEDQIEYEYNTSIYFTSKAHKINVKHILNYTDEVKPMVTKFFKNKDKTCISQEEFGAILTTLKVAHDKIKVSNTEKEKLSAAIAAKNNAITSMDNIKDFRFSYDVEKCDSLNKGDAVMCSEDIHKKDTVEINELFSRTKALVHIKESDGAYEFVKEPGTTCCSKDVLYIIYDYDIRHERQTQVISR